MPLKVSDGMGAWIDDFKKSDAPQFKGKSDKERRDQAIAAYMSAKNEQVDESSDAYGKSLEKEKEKRLTSNDQDKLARLRRMMDREKTKVAREPKGEYDRKVGSYLKKKYNKEEVELGEETTFEVEVEGLPTMYVKAKSPGEVKANLRKIVKQPSMITGVSRVTDADMKKVFRDKAQGREKEDDDLDEASVPHLSEANFAVTMKKAIDAHKRGDHKLTAYHLDNAKTARYAMKSTEISKHKDLLDKYIELRKMHEGKKPDYKAPGWMLRADPKLKAKVDANKAKNKEFKKLVGTKKEQASMCEQCGKVHEGNCSS